ncbi:methyltransferase [Actinacidiphila glaucinigra]|uniref:methyltransferase n=1 Tax=Actinacidiphila glaucinigra TaxID=235986 RepID=UPI0033B165C0
MKLSKQQARDHATARDLVEAHRPLTEDEAEFVLDHWQEAATARNALDGAFFTPAGLGTDLAVEVVGHRVIDLCAGIGRLAWSWRNLARARGRYEVVCVERNPLYVEVGRKVLPEARWICADIFHLPGDLRTFDTAMANPPFGSTERTGNAPRYTGRRFEYHAIDVAADLAPHGVFIVPQESAPFRDSGRPYFTEERDEECERFERQTGIRLGNNCGINTSGYADQWHGVAPRIEVVLADFATRQSPTGRKPVSTQIAPQAPRPVRRAAVGPEPVGTLF